jgi:hypothetical protein
VSNYKNLPLANTEPAGHDIGRSRGGLTTKIHTAVDGKGRPFAVEVTGGQRNDGQCWPQCSMRSWCPALAQAASAPALRP